MPSFLLVIFQRLFRHFHQPHSLVHISLFNNISQSKTSLGMSKQKDERPGDYGIP